MRNILDILREKAISGEFVAFDYKKDDGSVKRRKVRLGIDVYKKMDKQGTPVSGVGNWHKSLDKDVRGFILKKGSETYVRGTDVETGQLRIFKVNNISNIK